MGAAGHPADGCNQTYRPGSASVGIMEWVGVRLTDWRHIRKIRDAMGGISPILRYLPHPPLSSDLGRARHFPNVLSRPKIETVRAREEVLSWPFLGPRSLLFGAWLLLAVGLLLPWFNSGSERTLGIQLEDGETLALILVGSVIAAVFRLRTRHLTGGIVLALTSLLIAWIAVVDAFTQVSATPPFFAYRSPRSHVGAGLYVDAVAAIVLLVSVALELRASDSS